MEQEGKIFWGGCNICKCDATKGLGIVENAKSFLARLTTFIENGHNPDRLSNLNKWKEEEKGV